MKKSIKYTSLIGFIFLVGCTDFGSTNISPNGSSVPLTSALLSGAIGGSLINGTAVVGFGNTSTSGAGVTSGLYCQYFAQTLYTDGSRYSRPDYNWNDLSRTIYDLQNIININTDPKTKDYAALNGSNNNQIAVARILKAIWFSYLTDRYGDMPYSEALKGIAQPKYDTQQSIYTDLFKELTEAVAQFDNLPAANGDILFNGNIAMWKKFANSWRLILALRISKVDAAKGKAEFNAALSDPNGVLQTSADDVNLNYPGNASEFNNPWYGLGGDQNIATTVSDSLNINGDARNQVYGNPSSPGGPLVGFPYGLTRNDALTYTTNNPAHSLILNDTYRQTSSTFKILTAADVLLARAEAAYIGWTSEDYKQMYTNGIKESWNHWNVYGDGTAYNNYIGRPNIDLTSGKGSVAYKIAVQRWLSFYPDGPQGWSEWRRTGYPILTAPSGNNNPSGLIPVRIPYPTVEYGLNTANVNAAVALIENGKDDLDGHVWWDK